MLYIVNIERFERLCLADESDIKSRTSFVKQFLYLIQWKNYWSDNRFFIYSDTSSTCDELKTIKSFLPKVLTDNTFIADDTITALDLCILAKDIEYGLKSKQMQVFNHTKKLYLNLRKEPHLILELLRIDNSMGTNSWIGDSLSTSMNPRISYSTLSEELFDKI